jgi:hypothetical protein
MRNLFFFFTLIINPLLHGQNFGFKADLEKASDNGFIRIELTPEITSKLNNQFTDIRLYDSQNQEIPTLLHQEKPYTEKELFVPYKIIEKQHFSQLGYSRLVIHNPNKKAIDNLILRVKNADVKKQLKLNASYDNKTWYVLKDNYSYNSITNNDSTSEIRVLNFPLSDYEYYELLIDDYFDKPINITQAGFYNRQIEQGSYSAVNCDFVCLDTLKQTLISIPMNGQYVDKISFLINAPTYYYRQAEFFTYRTETYKNKTTRYEHKLFRCKLISNSSNTFQLNSEKMDTLWVRILNQDNQALKIDAIHVYQLKKYLIADLNSKKSYHLAFGDKKAVKANYDLEYFTDSIPANLEILSPQAPVALSKKNQTIKSDNFSLSNCWLWISIVIIALLLAYMSVKMVKENKNE